MSAEVNINIMTITNTWVSSQFLVEQKSSTVSHLDIIEQKQQIASLFTVANTAGANHT